MSTSISTFAAVDFSGTSGSSGSSGSMSGRYIAYYDSFTEVLTKEHTTDKTTRCFRS